ncbi:MULTISPECIES: D-aminoacylase [unclassified Pseudoalteromonas]|uniref:N-acyl-D-amino-acid deacylase family protein n=1 Tax=unclassified Pseudoalteromonas TaxID=194690 RepID=UPI000C069A16|nr:MULTISPECIES: D-aminoacylase [unclassified Pseudoalteromonas]MDP2633187.1 D-aminoacylase [Pseudoalteromonas sp. 1_MG-2023]PHN91835.1 D-aminoacylase [Pseudoalteromonas sp. 3D05]
MQNTSADLIIQGARVFIDKESPIEQLDVAIKNDLILAIGKNLTIDTRKTIPAQGLILAPGFIDVHTHDDLEVLRNPTVSAKLSQGVTTVIAGNCGISAVPTTAISAVRDPINLLGGQSEFVYPDLLSYKKAFAEVKPSVNLAMLIGHISLRAQVMDNLEREATVDEINEMKRALAVAMKQGALGLSTGLAYYNAKEASQCEINELAKVVTPFDGLYTTHLRSEFQGIINAMDEAFATAKQAKLPLVISHIKCAGQENWGRSKEVLAHFEQQKQHQHIGCDCYPYSASSSTLDLKQVNDDTEIFITWSKSFPDMAQQSLSDIAKQWQVSQLEAASRIQPAGAVYHCMLESDVKTFLGYEHSMIGSDGLPCDPHPHPRLWGTFPRVLGHYCREEKLFSLNLALHKMTALPAEHFKLCQRGKIEIGFFADLVLFDPEKIIDNASYSNPQFKASGIEMVWVNGTLSYQSSDNSTEYSGFGRAGQFLNRHNHS